MKTTTVKHPTDSRAASSAGLRARARLVGAAVYTPKRGIEGGRGPVLVDREEFEKLIADAEDARDLRDHDAVMASQGPGDWISADGALAIVGGANPIKVWRKERGLTQVELAKAAKLSQSHLAEIERGRKEPSVSVLRALAAALRVEPGDLI